MKARRAVGAAAAAALFLALGGALREPRPPYAVDGPLTEPRMLAPGVISTADDEFGGAFTPDGKTVFFDKTVSRHYLYVICESHFVNGTWTTPEIAPFSGVYRDSDPVLSPDGRTLFFVSDRPVNGRPKTDFDIWIVKKTASGWSEPENLGAPVNGESGEYFASVTAKGDLYFSSDRTGGKGGLDVWVSRLVNGKYGEPVNLGDAINTPAWELDCMVAPDESFMIVGAIGRPDSYGNYDLYVSRNRDGAWTPVESLGPKINTASREYSPRLSPDGRYLFFTSEMDFATKPLERRLEYGELVRAMRGIRNGSGNIYQVDLAAVLRSGAK
jgi:Tol biopolymer transport system component